MINAERIWKSPDLPTLPNVAVRLLELSKDVESEITDFVSVLRTDPAISTRLIKAANSSYFGFPSRVSSVEGAVPLLGTTMVTSLALSFSLVLESDGAMSKEDYTRFWSRSVLQAVSAEYLATESKQGYACEYFLAGLLCDVGVLAQMRAIPYAYGEILKRAHEQHESLLEIEREELGFDHVDIGCRMMENWQMPDVLADAIKYHHTPLAELDQVESLPHAPLVRTTRFVTALGDYFEQGGRVESWQELCELGSSFFQLDETALQTMLEEMRDRAEKAAQLLSIDATSLPHPSELLSRANAQLAEIALREHVAKVEVAAKTTALERQNKELKERTNRLLRDVTLDSLTGVANRRAFDENFEEMLSVCLRQGKPAGVIFVDVDNFKVLNDTHGHPFGDFVLQRIAELLKRATRDSDLIARYGGEEFVLVIVNCPAETICAVAERIRDSVEQEVFQHDGERVNVTISVGGSTISPNRTQVPSHVAIARRMLSDADTAMYFCKNNGRNRTQIQEYATEEGRVMA